MLDKLNHYIEQLRKMVESRDISAQNDLSKSRLVNITPSDDVDDPRVVEDVSASFENASVVQNTSFDFCLSPSSLDEVHVFSRGY